MLVRLGARGATSPCSSSSRTSASRPRSRSMSRSWSTAGSTASWTRAALAADRDLQQRLLGVGRHGRRRRPDAAPAPRQRRPTAPAGPRCSACPRRRSRSTSPNPCLPTRWSQPVPNALGSARATRDSRHRAACDRALRGAPAPAACPSRSASAGRRWSSARSTPRARNCASSATGFARCGVRDAHWSISRPPASRRAPTSPPQEVARDAPARLRGVFTGDRGASVTAMAEAFERWIDRERGIGGVISAPAARAAPRSPRRHARACRSACRR